MTNIPMTKQSQTNDPVVVPSTRHRKKSAKWWEEERFIEILIAVVQGQANQGGCNGNNLTKEGWRATTKKFRAITSLNCDDIEIKNKLDALKRKCLVWDKLFRKKVDLGWNNIEPSDYWWDKKFLENPRAAYFQYKALKFSLKLTFLFALGAHTLARYSGVFPIDLKQGYDCHDAGSLEKQDIVKGSGDSEDPDFGASTTGGAGDGASVGGGISVGTNFGLGNFRLNKSQTNLLSGVKQTQQNEMNTNLDCIYEAAESHTSGDCFSKIHDDDNPY